MIHHLHAVKSAARFLRKECRRADARARRNRPGVLRLESRSLLATVAEIPVPSGSGSAPDGMVNVPGGSIWFTEFGADKIASINPSTDAVAEFPIPSVNAEPFRITLGSDGNLWFTEIGVDKIGEFNPATGKITEYAVPTAQAQPFGITAGPNNTVWFTEWAGNQIGSINTKSGKITEYAVPTSNAVARGHHRRWKRPRLVYRKPDQPDCDVRPSREHVRRTSAADCGPKTVRDHRRAGRQPLFHGIHRQPGGRLQSEQLDVFTVFHDSDCQYPTDRDHRRARWDGLVHAEPDQPGGDAQPLDEGSHRGFDADGRVGSARNRRRERRITLVCRAEFGKSRHDRARLEPDGDNRAFATGNTGPDIWSHGRRRISVRGRRYELPRQCEPGDFRRSRGRHACRQDKREGVDGIATFTGLSFSASGSYQLQVKSGTTAPAAVGPILAVLPITVPPLIPSTPAAAAPVVLSEQLVTAGKGKNKYVSGVVITFSTALDPTTAQNASNYTVIQTAKGGRASAAKAIRLHARYKLANKTVKLTFVGKPRFAAGGQLILNAANPGGLASLAGVRLEGNMGTDPGSDGMYKILPNGRGMAN